MPELKTTMLEYQAKLLVLARQLIRTFALGLGLEENYFDSMVDAPFQTLLLQYYPPRPAGAADLDSLGAHVDYESRRYPLLSRSKSFV
jgi:isopenicillin N synthase-like dioxygenase